MANPIGKILDREGAFNKALATFIKSTKIGMSAARTCAELSLAHFEATGDVIFLTRFHDAMPKNYARRAAFIQWAAAHSPLAMAEGKFCKDKGEKANKFDLKAACLLPFWDFAPEKVVVLFESNDVVVRLEAVIKQFRNDKRFKPKDEAAAKKLATLEQAIKAVA